MLPRMLLRCLAVAVVGLVGCGSQNDDALHGSRRSPPIARDAGRARPAPAQAAPVDLLQSVVTDVAVSSVYRDQRSEAVRLVDGNLGTAWNSRTGDLVGAWIDVRVPAAATVTSISLTAGFTRGSGENDLFMGNHRIARVRVLRDGAEIGRHGLDPSSRERQLVPVSGPGGVYRIEVAEVVAGTHEGWREVCVSDLRVMGRAPDASEGTRFPRVSVGELAAPRGAPGSMPRDEIARAYDREVAWQARAWTELEDEIDEVDSDHSASTLPEVPSLERARQAILARASSLPGLGDRVESDRLRRAAVTPVDWNSFPTRHAGRVADLGLVAAAFEAVGSSLDDANRCRWARAHAGVRIHRLRHMTANERTSSEADAFHMEDENRRTSRRIDALYHVAEELEAADWEWSRNAATQAARLRRLTLPEFPDAQSDWDAMRAQLDVTRRTCGWR